MEKIELSNLEKKIIRNVKRGHRNKRIGEIMEMNIKTLSSIKIRIKGKLCISPRANDYLLVQKCIENNLI